MLVAFRWFYIREHRGIYLSFVLERSARSTPFNAMFFSLPADLLQVGESFDCHILPSGSIVPECLHTEAYFILVQVALHLFYVKIRAFLNLKKNIVCEYICYLWTSFQDSKGNVADIYMKGGSVL